MLPSSLGTVILAGSTAGEIQLARTEAGVFILTMLAEPAGNRENRWTLGFARATCGIHTPGVNMLLGHRQRTQARTHKRTETLDGCCSRAGQPQTVSDNRSSSRVPPLWIQVVGSEPSHVSHPKRSPMCARIAHDAVGKRKCASAGRDASERSGSSEHDGAKHARRKPSPFLSRCSATGRHNTL